MRRASSSRAYRLLGLGGQKFMLQALRTSGEFSQLGCHLKSFFTAVLFWIPKEGTLIERTTLASARGRS